MDAFEQLNHNLTNHPPASQKVVEDMEEIRGFAKEFGRAILRSCPESRERSLALTYLEQSVMFSIAALARYQKDPS